MSSSCSWLALVGVPLVIGVVVAGETGMEVAAVAEVTAIVGVMLWVVGE